MSPVRLRDYDNSWYHPGRSKLWQLGWFFVGAPLVRSAINPLSGLRVRILRFFGAQMGMGIVIKPGVQIKYPWHLKVGDHCWLGENCWIDNLTSVRIGSDVCISQGAYLCTGNHNWSVPSFPLSVEPIILGDGAWVGAKSFLAPGVVLGECAIATGGSVVTRNIPAYEVHSGNPAAFIRRRSFKDALVPSPTAESKA